MIALCFAALVAAASANVGTYHHTGVPHTHGVHHSHRVHHTSPSHHYIPVHGHQQFFTTAQQTPVVVAANPVVVVDPAVDPKHTHHQVVYTDKPVDTVLVNPVHAETVVVKPTEQQIVVTEQSSPFTTVSVTGQKETVVVPQTQTVTEQKATVVVPQTAFVGRSPYSTFDFGKQVYATYQPMSYAYYAYDKPVMYKPATGYTHHTADKVVLTHAPTHQKEVTNHHVSAPITTHHVATPTTHQISTNVGTPVTTHHTHHVATPVESQKEVITNTDTIVYTPVPASENAEFALKKSHKYHGIHPTYGMSYKPTHQVYTPHEFKKVETNFQPISHIYKAPSHKTHHFTSHHGKDVASIYKNIDATKKHFEHLSNAHKYDIYSAKYMPTKQVFKTFDTVNKYEGKHINTMYNPNVMYKNIDTAYTPVKYTNIENVDTAVYAVDSMKPHFKNVDIVKTIDTINAFNPIHHKNIETIYKTNPVHYKTVDTVFKTNPTHFNVNKVYKTVDTMTPFASKTHAFKTVDTVRKPFTHMKHFNTHKVHNVHNVHAVNPTFIAPSVHNTHHNTHGIYEKVHTTKFSSKPKYHFRSVIENPIGHKIVDTKITNLETPETTITKGALRTEDIRTSSKKINKN